jgi:nucleoside-diphosphate-sugar epimerase
VKVFVTGATGVLGQPTLRLLLARKHQVTALVRNESGARRVSDLGAAPLVADLFEPDSIRTGMEGAESVLHLATAIPKKGAPSSRDWAMNDRIRTEGTRNLLNAAPELALRSFVLQSVAYLYGDTRGEWRREDDPLPRKVSRSVRSAVEMESHALAEYKVNATPVVILRGASFYAPTAYSTRAMLNALQDRRFPIIGSGEQYWHWVYVDDMARAVVLAAEHPAPGEIFNVADDWAFHAGDGINYLAAQLHAPAPFRMSKLLARAMGGEAAGFLAQSARYRADKIKKMLGWTPLYPTYREGFAEIFRQMGKRV